MSECHCIDPGLQLNCKQPNLAAHSSLVLWANSFLRRCLLNLWTFHTIVFSFTHLFTWVCGKSSFLVSCNVHTLWTHSLFREFDLSFLLPDISGIDFFFVSIMNVPTSMCADSHWLQRNLTRTEETFWTNPFLSSVILATGQNKMKWSTNFWVNFAFLVSLEPVLNSDLKWLKQMFNYFVQKKQ